MGGAMAAALTAAQLMVKEILEGSTQRDLLAYARAFAFARGVGEHAEARPGE